MSTQLTDLNSDFNASVVLLMTMNASCFFDDNKVGHQLNCATKLGSLWRIPNYYSWEDNKEEPGFSSLEGQLNY